MSRIQNPLPQLIPSRTIRAQHSLQNAIWAGKEPILLQIGPLHDSFITIEEAQKEIMRPLAPKERFGAEAKQWDSCWGKIEIPSAAENEAGQRFFLWDGFGEITIYLDGAPWWGLDHKHREVPLPDHACTLWLSFGLWYGNDGAGMQYNNAEIGLRNQLAWDCYWDLTVLNELMAYLLKKETGVGIEGYQSIGHRSDLPTITPLLRHLLREMDDAINIFDTSGMEALQPALRAIYQRYPAESWQPTVSMSGHAHIDLVWLWPERVADQKGLHTFSTQLRLMEMYPEFTFSQSQPALYRAVEKLSPAIMSRIKDRIAEGRWEATGATEVELDTLVPCGESMARSVIIGQRKFRELRGGTASSVCWIPDVFGYNSCLPQVLKLGGVPAFFTTKMTWSTVTKFPYTSFVWRGSDGSEVLTHLCTRSYNGQAQINDLIGGINDHRQCDVHNELLYPHGYGDGGGGVTFDALERARRVANLASVPRTKWSTVESFYRRMETVRKRLPVYQGELYLEYHRGTYTTQSEFKRLHRAGERALQLLEAARVATGNSAKTENDWQRVLFAEFHDALPGSSIELVYQQMNPELAALESRVTNIAITELTDEKNESGVHIFNPLAVSRTTIIDYQGKQFSLKLPALSSIPLTEESCIEMPQFLEVSAQVIDNGLLRAEFDDLGRLAVLLIDGENMLLEEPGNFLLFHDLPHAFDAWDIDHYTYQFPHPVGGIHLDLCEDTPLRVKLCGTTAIGEKSSLTVSFILEAGSRWLQIQAEVDWQESHQILRYHLPSGFRGRMARFGNPFGSIQRIQQPGLQADEAMWEVPGNRWAAVLHDDGNGLAIVTEAKYGFSAKDGELGVSLLRSSKGPDPNADMGNHQISFAVGKHQSATEGDVVSTSVAAELLFTPPVIVPEGKAIAPSFFFSSLSSLTPSWVLPSENGEGYIIRMHETNGSAGIAQLQFTIPPREIRSVNFLEETIVDLPWVQTSELEIPFQPYQVISILVVP